MYSARGFHGKKRRSATMSSQSGPREFPLIRLELVDEPPPSGAPPFLRLLRRRVRAHYPDGKISPVFTYDEVERRAIDAVVVAAHYLGPGGERRVFLRSALRPPLYFRGRDRAPVEVPDTHGALWELPAGLIEPEEQNREGLARAAARELHEEAGLVVEPPSLRLLGPSVFPSPGVIAERHFFFEVVVDPATRVEPPLDGSALEKHGVVIDLAVAEALAMCASGEIEDGKTELLLRRLAERYP
jgi:ADP-ribose pyrophosphatase